MIPPREPRGETAASADRLAVHRIVDANLNRALEGIRVVEEYARFGIGDVHLTREWKQLRHQLVQLLSAIPAESLLAARDSLGDVGADIAAADEYHRPNAAAVAAASGNRIEQALRCLEEYLKIDSPQVAHGIERLRYRAYSLSRGMSATTRALVQLTDTHLCVLLDGRGSLEACQSLARELISGGARMLQLRDKQLTDRVLLERARLLRGLTRPKNVIFIVNDRPDIARLCDADGVHLGQDDMSVHDARSLLGPDRLIGVSTHAISQARRAVLDGASYIGCGPTFPSQTKQFVEFPGTPFLKQAADELQLPAFAIGGITLDNLPEIREAGMKRVAVGSAIANAPDPADATTAFTDGLRG